jgi:phage shock protein A
MLDMSSSGNKTPKSFWKRPEGVTGGIFMGGIIFGVGYLLYTLLPFIVSILHNTLKATIFFVLLAALLYVIFDKKFRTLVWYMYKSVMRAITSWFVQIDPIGILETYVEDLYKNLREMDGHIAKLKGQVAKLQRVIDDNAHEMEESMRMAEQAKKAGNKDVLIINTRQYGRLEESNKRYKELLGKMEILYRILSKMYKNSGYLIKDIENEVRMRKQERAAIQAGYSAMKRAMSIINGDPDKKMMFDQAMEAIVDDVSNKVGEMERFMEVSSSFIDSIDLQNGIYEQKGLELLEKMENEGISFLMASNKSKEIPTAEEAKVIPADETKKNAPDDKATDNNYKNFFN